jgi:hypothetical protein
LQAGVASYHSPPIQSYGGSGKRSNVFGREYLLRWEANLPKWAEKIAERPLDENDGDAPPIGIFNPIAVFVRRNAAAAFLRKHSAQLPEPARPHLERAARQYEQSARAADQLSTTLHDVGELDGLDWHGKLLAVQEYIGEGPGMAEAVSDYAKAYPKRWAARSALIRRVNRICADKPTIEKARGLVSSIIKSDDAAIAEIEKALAAAE